VISPATIALVKDRTDIVAIVGETVKLTRRGRSFVGLCPFHKEKTPSFHVAADRGFFHCFGCKESGGAIDFVMKIEGRTFPEAVTELAGRLGIEVEKTESDLEAREAAAARKQRDDLYQVNNLAAMYFERCMRGSPDNRTPPHPLANYAIDELGRRGLALDPPTGTMADTLQAFRVGYAPYGWDGLAQYFKQQGISPTQAERVGLLVPRTSGSGHYDRFRHRLMFAVTDVMGRVIAFSGRALAEPSAEDLARIGVVAREGDGQAPAKYLNSPESPIYTKGEHLFGLHQARQSIRQEGDALLVEGNFDVVSLHARGVQNVVAPLGTAFTSHQAKLLKRFCPTVIVLFDGDNAGKKATRASRASCREGGLEAKVARLSDGADPDTYVREKGVEGLARVVKAAKGMLEYLIDDALDYDKFSSASVNEQQARAKHVVDLLRDEVDPNLRLMSETYANRLAQKLLVHGRPIDDLKHLLNMIVDATSRVAVPARPASQVAEPPDRARSRSLADQVALDIFGALLDFPELVDDPVVADAISHLGGDVALAVAVLREHARSAPPFERDGVQITPKHAVSAEDFLAAVPRTIHPFAVERLASPGYEVPEDAKQVVVENAEKLLSLSLKRENAAGIDELQKMGARGDTESEDALLREVAARARRKPGVLGRK
jgi:DNA primase